MSNASIEKHLARARAALDLRRYGAAEREAREALRFAPTNATALRALTRALIGLSRLDEAAEAAARAVSVAPEDAESHYLAGWVEQQGGRAFHALEPLKTAVRLEPRTPHYLTALAWGHALVHQRAEALELVDRVLALAPDDPDVLASVSNTCRACGDTIRAESVAVRLRSMVPDETTSHLIAGRALLAAGRAVDAHRSACEAVRQSPADVQVWRLYIDTAARLNMFREAERGYRETLRLVPDDLATTLTFAKYLLQLGKAYGTKEVCLSALKRWPANRRFEEVLTEANRRLSAKRNPGRY